MTTNPDQDLETKAGLIKRTRKAFVAAGTTFVGALGPSVVVATSDGAVSAAEIIPLVVVAAGLAFAAWCAVWRVPNAT